MKIDHNYPNQFNAQLGIPVHILATKPERLEIKVKERIGDFSVLEDGRLMYFGLFIKKEGANITMRNDIYYGSTSLPNYMENILLKDLIEDSTFRFRINSLYNYVRS